jgi:hypothetical protein
MPVASDVVIVGTAALTFMPLSAPIFLQPAAPDASIMIAKI